MFGKKSKKLLTRTTVRDRIKSVKKFKLKNWEEWSEMKELLKSKMIIGFMVVVLGLTYMSSNMTAKMDENIKESNHEIAVNV